MRGAEIKPARNADGIVVLTGGSSRVSDAMELLADGYGKRLLISGVHPTNAASDISRSLPDNQSLLGCCVDLDRSAVNTRSNAAETRRWAHERGFKSLIVVTSNYHMPRAIVELSHAMPDIALIPFAVVGDKWRDEPWWTSGATFGCCCRNMSNTSPPRCGCAWPMLGLDLMPDLAEQPAGSLPPHRPATASSQLIGSSMVSIFLRSLVYNVLFYVLLVFWIIVAIPDLSDAAARRSWRSQGGGRAAASGCMRVICNTRVEYRGLEKIPKGPLIVASKHQSMWETFALLQFFDQPLFIFKRELTWIPLFGWYLVKSNMIGIDRDAPAADR